MYTIKVIWFVTPVTSLIVYFLIYALSYLINLLNKKMVGSATWSFSKISKKHGLNVFNYWVPEGQTVNQAYLQVLQKLRQYLRKKSPALWNTITYSFHQGNMLAPSGLSVKDMLADKTIPVFKHPLFTKYCSLQSFSIPKINDPERNPFRDLRTG